MITNRAGRVLCGAALLATGLSGAAAAQTGNVHYPPGAVVQPLGGVEASRLADFVRALAINPRNLSSLLGAGQAALEIGDTEAALSFFARAEEVAPRDGRVKAGMGSAFVQTQQPHAALKFFADAVALGAPMSLVAKDRGLAYDMIGDTANAQADYTRALQFGVDPEVERRLALSRAISGDKAGALAALDGQLRQNDRAGRRAHAFVLALTGDTEGAVRAVQAVMPAQAAAMRPFLARLSLLANADKALAVHFGHFPAGARYAATPTSTPAAAPLRTVEAQPSQSRRPANFEVAGRGQSSSETSLRPASAIVAAPAPSQPAPQPIAPVTPARDVPAASELAFADIAAVVAALPEAPAEAQEPAPAKPEKRAEPLKQAERKAAPAKPKEPSRIWVQIAAAQNKKAFPAEFRRIRGKADKLLDGKTAWTTPFGETNRLLVGPFKTGKEARDLVNALSKVDIDSLSWTSEAGQAIEKIPAK